MSSRSSARTVVEINLPKPSLIGVIHLSALPGSPRHDQSTESIVQQALQDAEALENAGFDAVIIENFGDVPFPADALEPGAVAAPTAGLHFDTALLEALRSKGVGIVEVTLHVGPGTFQPIESDRTEDHAMHSERYAVEQSAWATIQQAKDAGQRIVSVGTTSARVLETVAQTGRLSGETDIFIYAPYSFALVDALLTNFHLPRSTLLAMIYAFGGTDLMRRVYAHAIEQRYRFYSYGDAMLIE